MRILNESIIYDNPLPQLKSRQSFFPSLCELKDESILAAFTIGEAFESVDSACYVCKSNDLGNSWSQPQQIFNKSQFDCAVTEYCKISLDKNGDILAFGYAFPRPNNTLPLGNPETGGLLDDFVFISKSKDGGNTFSQMQKIDCSWGPHIEASAPITVLNDGSYISPITCFADWNGNATGTMCGKALKSTDGGKTWNDDAVCMEFENNNVTCFEQRMCQLESGTILNIGWNENIDTGELLNNHFTYSDDNGKTWSKPLPTSTHGQASSLCAIGGEKFISLHAVRRDSKKPGIYANVIDFSNKKWDVVDQAIIWEPATPIVKNEKFADVFAYLKFGQPSAIKLSNGNLLATHWFMEQGQYKVTTILIEL